jgi:hypothetical protein
MTRLPPSAPTLQYSSTPLCLLPLNFGFVPAQKQPFRACYPAFIPCFLPLFAKRTQLVFLPTLFIPKYFHSFPLGSFGKNTSFLESPIPTEPSCSSGCPPQCSSGRPGRSAQTVSYTTPVLSKNWWDHATPGSLRPAKISIFDSGVRRKAPALSAVEGSKGTPCSRGNPPPIRGHLWLRPFSRFHRLHRPL